MSGGRMSRREVRSAFEGRHFFWGRVGLDCVFESVIPTDFGEEAGGHCDSCASAGASADSCRAAPADIASGDSGFGGCAGHDGVCSGIYWHQGDTVGLPVKLTGVEFYFEGSVGLVHSHRRDVGCQAGGYGGQGDTGVKGHAGSGVFSDSCFSGG